MISITGVKQTNAALRELRNGVAGNATEMLHIANDAVAMIETRTGMGRDMHGASFPPYTFNGTYYAPVAKRPAGYPMPAGGRRVHKRTGAALRTVAYDGGYAAYKAAIGRGIVPQLSVSGEMLGDMVVRAGDGWAEIYFASELSKAKAHGHHVSGRYHFFGLDFATIEEMHAEMIKYIRKIRDKVGLA